MGTASKRHNRDDSRHKAESSERVSRSSPTGTCRAPTWEPSFTPAEKLSIHDLSDDQSMKWAALNTQSPFFDPSNVAQPEMDSCCWQGPLRNSNHNRSVVSPLGSSNDMVSLLELPTARPTGQLSPPPQQHHKSICPGSQSRYSNSIGLSDSSDQFSPSNLFVAGANSTDSPNSNANQSISLCTQIIVYLESQMSDNSLGLDGILRISKTCMNDLLRITTLKSCQANPNCLLLLCVAVNQMITLLENSIGAKTSPLDPLCGSTLPSLLFGTFQVDQEEQLAFCTRLICREIQRYRQLLDRMKGMNQIHHGQQQCDHFDKSAHSTANLLQEEWFLTSLERLNSLIVTVTI